MTEDQQDAVVESLRSIADSVAIVATTSKCILFLVGAALLRAGYVIEEEIDKFSQEVL